jgi:hypothetical protein
MGRRSAVTVVLCGALAVPAAASGAAQPPDIALRLGVASTDRVCVIGGRYEGVGADGAAFAGSAKQSVHGCRGFPALRVRRARRLTITLRDPAAAIEARWYSARGRTSLAVQPAGEEAPASTWALSVPSASGRLVLGVTSPPQPAPGGGVWQIGTDYRVVVRRRAPASRRSCARPCAEA